MTRVIVSSSSSLSWIDLRLYAGVAIDPSEQRGGGNHGGSPPPLPMPPSPPCDFCAAAAALLAAPHARVAAAAAAFVTVLSDQSRLPRAAAAAWLRALPPNAARALARCCADESSAAGIGIGIGGGAAGGGDPWVLGGEHDADSDELALVRRCCERLRGGLTVTRRVVTGGAPGTREREGSTPY